MLLLRMLLKLPTKKLMLVRGETHITNYKRQLNKIKLYTLFIVMPNFKLNREHSGILDSSNHGPSTRGNSNNRKQNELKIT